MVMKNNEIIEESFFQMPLHYPRFTKKDYQTMPEWQLDRLLAEYGLPKDGDLSSKREFAMGAFLWPDDNQDQDCQITAANTSAGSCGSFHHCSSMFMGLFYRVIGGNA
ncbi:hypothetical protein M5689_001955 [Euphorbia peplus]|nr:hypothetical protein M5689_001955 [Euphorbia peplus]